MRECPAWFQSALTRIGGVNQYGQPLFKLVWSTEPRMTVGGRFKDGYVGYRQARSVAGKQCWCLMVWEPRELMGSPERWEFDYRNEDGLLDCGGYPKYGRYRLLQKFAHTEVVQQPYERQWIAKDGTLCTDILKRKEVREYRMEPCGLILDLMLPMLMMWRRLTGAQKWAAVKQEERLKTEDALKKVKDAREGCRVMRGGALVRKRAEQIEKDMHRAMEIAARCGLGIQVMN